MYQLRKVKFDFVTEPWHPQGGTWQLCCFSFHLPRFYEFLLQLQQQMFKKNPNVWRAHRIRCMVLCVYIL